MAKPTSSEEEGSGTATPFAESLVPKLSTKNTSYEPDVKTSKPIVGAVIEMVPPANDTVSLILNGSAENVATIGSFAVTAPETEPANSNC